MSYRGYFKAKRELFHLSVILINLNFFSKKVTK